MSDDLPLLPVTAFSHYAAFDACDNYLLRSITKQSTRDGHWCDDKGWAKELGDETEKMFTDQCGHVGTSLEMAEEVAAAGGQGVATQVELKGEFEDDRGNRIALRGKADFIVVERDVRHAIRYTVVEIKTAVSERAEFVLQAALYVHLLRAHVGERGSVHAKIIRRNPETDTIDADAFNHIPDLDDNLLHMALDDARLIVTRFFLVREQQPAPPIQFAPSCAFCKHGEDCLADAVEQSDWSILGLTANEQQALRDVGGPSQTMLDRNTHSKAVGLGLRHSRMEIGALMSVRVAFFQNTGGHEVQSQGDRRLPTLGETRLLKVFLMAQRHPRRNHLDVVGSCWVAYDAEGKREQIGRASVTVLSPASEKRQLQEFVSSLLKTIDAFLAKGLGRVHFYVWRQDEVAALVDRCAHHSSGDDALMSFARALTERHDSGNGHARFTSLAKQISHHCTVGCLGDSLLSIGLLNWPNASSIDERAKQWLELKAYLGDFIADDVAAITDVVGLRKAVAARPWLLPHIPERAVRAMREGCLDSALIANAWLLTLFLVEEAYRKIAQNLHDLQVPEFTKNVWRAPFPLSDRASVQTALDYMNGANAHARRSWIARNSAPPERLAARGKGVIVNDLKWGNKSGARRRLDGELDLLSLPRSTNSGGPREILSALKLSNNVRAAPFAKESHDLPFASLEKQAIRFSSVVVEDGGSFITRPIKVMPAKYDPGQPVSAQVDPWVDRSETDPAWSTTTSALIIKDPERPFDEELQPIEKLIDPKRPATLRALDWLDQSVPAPAPFSAQTRNTLSLMLDAYLAAKNEQDPARRAAARRSVQGVKVLLDGRISLVQGPPGTGKTEFAALFLLSWLLGRRLDGKSASALIFSHSHGAVKNVLIRSGVIADKLKAALESLSEQWPGILMLEKWVGAQQRVPKDKVFGQAGPAAADAWMQVADKHLLANPKPDLTMPQDAMRLVGIVANQLFRPATVEALGQPMSDLLIIDEASQMMSLSLLPALDLLSHNGAALVVGDHRQLPPIGKGPMAADIRPHVRQRPPYASIYDTVNRMADEQPAAVTRFGLNFTFRLPTDLWQLIAPIYVKDGITLTGDTARSTPYRSGLPLIPTAEAETDTWEGVILVTYDARTDTSQWTNEIEIALAEELVKNAHGKPDVRVLAPFNRQVDLLNGKLGPVAGSVDSLQGQQSATVIYSPVADRNVLSAIEDFVLSLNRLNVALSRAQRRLIVLASTDLLAHLASSPATHDAVTLWKRLRHYAQASVHTLSVTVSGQAVTAEVHPVVLPKEELLVTAHSLPR